MRVLIGAGYALSGVALFIAPLLSWRNLQLMGLPVGLPGLLWHGAWLSALGVAIGLASLEYRRLWLPLLLGWFAGALLSWQMLTTVLLDGDRLLMQMQLRLTPVNEALGRFGIGSFDFYRRTVPTLGKGPWVAGAALALLGTVLVIDFWTQRRQGRAWAAVIFGRTRCAACGWRLRDGMHFCPGCSQPVSSARLCALCHHAAAASDRFCSTCSQPLATSEQAKSP